MAVIEIRHNLVKKTREARKKGNIVQAFCTFTGNALQAFKGVLNLLDLETAAAPGD